MVRPPALDTTALSSLRGNPAALVGVVRDAMHRGPGTAELLARLEFIKPTPLLSVGSWPILQGVVSTKGSGVLLVEACDSAVRPCGCGPEGSSYSLQRIGQHTP